MDLLGDGPPMRGSYVERSTGNVAVVRERWYFATVRANRANCEAHPWVLEFDQATKHGTTRTPAITFRDAKYLPLCFKSRHLSRKSTVGTQYFTRRFKKK